MQLKGDNGVVIDEVRILSDASLDEPPRPVGHNLPFAVLRKAVDRKGRLERFAPIDDYHIQLKQSLLSHSLSILSGDFRLLRTYVLVYASLNFVYTLSFTHTCDIILVVVSVSFLEI